MLKIEGLVKVYSGNGVRAVDGLSLELKKGEIFGFLGPNGAGKSTTIKCITGILPLTEGKIEINGHDLKSNPISAKQSFGYVPDQHVVYSKLTGAEYVNFMADIYGVPTDIRKKRSAELFDLFHLTEAKDAPISSYSHGMAQKVSVIGALIHDPDLWILDEPLTGLDPQAAFELKELMRAHCRKGKTVFFSSHVLDVVEKLADRVGIIDDGRLVAVGTVDELKSSQDASLEDVFLKITGEAKDEQNA